MIRRLLPLTVPALLCFFAACSQPAESGGCTDECFTPPAPICNGDVLTSFSALGTCEEDRCVYPPVTTDCGAQGGTCETGACVLPEDPCEDVTCDAPPEAACEGDTLVTWSEAGECNGETGECEYTSQRTECDAEGRVCEGARCVLPGDPCIDVVCEDEPEDTCEGTVAVRYADSGTCEDGLCVYAESTRIDCGVDGGTCARGRCTAFDPCADVVCDAPPANRCEGGIAYSYPMVGTCTEDGECLYFETQTTCSSIGGQCGRTQCVVPGSCDGVVCDEPPAPRCVGNTRVVADDAGTCAAGECSYETTSFDCAGEGNICQDGECVAPDPCDGVICNAPPASTCTGNTRVAYAAPGSCSEGICSYSEARTDCATLSQVCVSGTCVTPDPCAGVTCDTAPPGFCRGDVVVGYVVPGLCESGVCSYDTDETDCAESGAICEEGACVAADPCLGVVCTTPAAECIGNVALEYFAPGVCEDGECNRDGTFVSTNCADAGLVCLLGECLRAGEALSAGAVRISEIFGGASSAPAARQWVELYNPGSNTVPLDGVVLRTLAAPASQYVFGEGAEIAAGAYLTVGGADSGADVLWDAGFGILASDGVELRSAVGLVDGLDWRSGSLPAGPDVSSSIDPTRLGGATGRLADWCQGGAATAPWGTNTQGSVNIACASRVAVGALQITELMVNGVSLSADPDQWFELRNTTASAINLRGVFFRSGDSSGRIVPESLLVDPGARVLIKLGIARSGLRFAFATPSILDAEADTVEVRVSGAIVDSVTYATAARGGTWVFAPGRSKERSTSAADASASSAWCDGSTPFAPTGNFGTPGAANVCP